MAGNFSWLRTSPERLETVIQDIQDGSKPQLSFFTLLGVASLIASMGLIANSTAVVIGAMLVSPLMTPIFGISLGMLRGDLKLVGRAFTAEIGGIALAVGSAYLCGLTPLLVEAQPEMIARTEPTILDLLVAVFAGFAGAFALVDERISPALPGVAIATAIVPPLSTSGLYLSLGQVDNAFGAFLLFVANFASLLLVGLLTFAAAGISPTFKWTTPSDIVRRLGFATIGFLVIVLFLASQIGSVVENRRAARTINKVLAEHLTPHGSGVLEKVRNSDFEWVLDDSGYRGTLRVLATVRSPAAILPVDVTDAEKALSAALDKRIVLVIRNLLQKEVASIGSAVRVSRGSGKSGLFDTEIPEDQKKTRLAEQLVLERLSDLPGFALESILWGESEHFPFVLATIRSIRPPSPDEVRGVRRFMRERMELPTLELLLRSYDSSLVTSEERYLFEWTSMSEVMAADEPLAADLRRIVEEEVGRIPDLYCVGVHFRMSEDPWRVLAEAVGPRVPTPEQVAAIQSAISERSTQKVDTVLWYRSDTIVTPGGYSSYKEFTENILEERIEVLPKIFQSR